ncbi:MAG TPA: glycosyltransferase family 4 protein [Longimicrobiales bacterium]|nr:glycosyltransferase family 4 protein [Longimicrobiales bacterium]
MKVVHLDAGREWRGGQRQALLLARGLAECGVESVVAAPAGSPLAERAAAGGLAVIPFAPVGDLDLVSAWGLASRVGPAAADTVLHAHDARSHAVALFVKGAVGPAGLPPLVVTRRSLPRRAGFFSRLKHRTGVDRYIAISAAVRAGLLALGVPAARIRVVASGVEPVGAVEAVDWRRRLGLHAAVRLAGSVGALSGEKGYLDLVEALPLLPADVHLVVVGEGPEREPLLRRAAALGVEGRLHLPGHLERPREAMAGFDAYVQPSRREGLGSSAIEALALGLPTLTTDAGGLAEVVEPDVSGLQVPVADPAALARGLARLLADESLRARLSAGALARARAFSVEAMVEGTWAVYREVLP